MWAAIADPSCAAMGDALSAAGVSNDGCEAGCEHDWEASHSPGLFSEGVGEGAVCVLPTIMAMGCLGAEPEGVTHKLCPCS
jgi:hypothetical protein